MLRSPTLYELRPCMKSLCVGGVAIQGLVEILEDTVALHSVKTQCGGT